MKLSEKQLELITKTAASIAIEKYQNEQKIQEKQKHDRRLRNIKLLLRNYHSFVALTDGIKLEIEELDTKLTLDDLDTDEFSIQTVKKYKHKTLAMLRFIDKTLQIYKLMCEKSNDPHDIRKYEIISYMYISEEKKTAKEIGECQFIDERTVFRIAKKAYEDLSVLIFGVDALRF